MAAPEGFKLELLTPEHRRKRFSSGNPKVDEWLRQKALPAMKKNTSTTRVLVDAGGHVAGYYSLANTVLDISLVPPELFAGQAPTRPPPTVTLAWLGIDAGFAGRGLGTYLFHQALADCVKAYDVIRYVAIIIDALDDDNVTHYRSRGFTLVPGTTHKLYMAASVLQSVAG